MIIILHIYRSLYALILKGNSLYNNFEFHFCIVVVTVEDSSSSTPSIFSVLSTLTSTRPLLVRISTTNFYVIQTSGCSSRRNRSRVRYWPPSGPIAYMSQPKPSERGSMRVVCRPDTPKQGLCRGGVTTKGSDSQYAQLILLTTQLHHNQNNLILGQNMKIFLFHRHQFVLSVCTS